VNASSSPFKDVAGGFGDRGVVQTSAGDRGAAAGGCLERENQLGVAKNRDVGVVGGDDDLPVLADLGNLAHDLLVDEPVIQVIIGLVDDDLALLR
jgi:hypothetical protein